MPPPSSPSSLSSSSQQQQQQQQQQVEYVWEKLRDDSDDTSPPNRPTQQPQQPSWGTSSWVEKEEPGGEYDEDFYLKKLQELQLMSRQSMNLSMDEVDQKLANREVQLRAEFAQFREHNQESEEPAKSVSILKRRSHGAKRSSSSSQDSNSGLLSPSETTSPTGGGNQRTKSRDVLTNAKSLFGLFKRSKSQQSVQTSSSTQSTPKSASNESLLRRFSVSLNLHKSGVSGGGSSGNVQEVTKDLSASPSEASYMNESNIGALSSLSKESLRASSSTSIQNPASTCSSPKLTPNSRHNSMSSIGSTMDESAQTEFDMWISQFDSANNQDNSHSVQEYNKPLSHDELSAFVAKFCLLAPEHNRDSIDLLQEKGVVYVKNQKGHFKESYVELSNAEISVWENRVDGNGREPSGRYPLDISFNLHRIGTTSVTIKQSSFTKRKSDPGHIQPQTVRGHVFAIVPNDRNRQELVLCIPDDDVYKKWMQCLDLYEIISFSTLQFTVSHSHQEALEHAIVDEYALFREQSQGRGDADFNKMMMEDYRNKIKQMKVCPF